MKRSSIVVALAAVLATLVATTAAFAAGPKDNHLYRYVGQVKAVDVGAKTVTVTVQNGNRAALRSLLGQSQEQTFATDDKTVILRWTKGIPTKIGLGDIAVNDYVTVNVRADRKADLATITKKPAASIGDRGPTVTKPAQPLYLFRGTLVSAGAGKVTIKVTGGNRHALKLLINQSREQAFTTNEDTVFLHWAKRIPTVISLEELSDPKKVGDRIVIRIRAAHGADLDTVKNTPAKRVADREPRNHEAHQNDQS